MRIHIIPRIASVTALEHFRSEPPILRLLAENAAEEAQLTQEHAKLKNAGAKVEWYGHDAGGQDHMAIGLEIELA